jgi:hypothetical protein
MNRKHKNFFQGRREITVVAVLQIHPGSAEFEAEIFLLCVYY